MLQRKALYLLTASIMSLVASTHAQAQGPAAESHLSSFPYRYTAKFICGANVPGSSATMSLPPGSYTTVIELNGRERTTTTRAKLIWPALSEVSDFITNVVPGNGTVAIDCGTEFSIVPIHGVEGFVVIESNRRLDAIAHYTAATLAGDVASVDVEYIPEQIP